MTTDPPSNPPANIATPLEPDRDEFGLPIRKQALPVQVQREDSIPESPDRAGKVAQYVKNINTRAKAGEEEAIFPDMVVGKGSLAERSPDRRPRRTVSSGSMLREERVEASGNSANGSDEKRLDSGKQQEKEIDVHKETPEKGAEVIQEVQNVETSSAQQEDKTAPVNTPMNETKKEEESRFSVEEHARSKPSQDQHVSEWSHQHVTTSKPQTQAEEELEWQDMPAYAPYDIYDDDNRLVAREMADEDLVVDAYAGLGGAGKGYTRVQLDEDAQSATSMDDTTAYLFKNGEKSTGAGEYEDDEARDALSQMQATKDFLTEGQKIAYVGMTRIVLSTMVEDLEKKLDDKKMKKELRIASEAMKMWGQKVMLQLYKHMDISSAEQVMIEQLAEHGVLPADLTPTLMANARIKNPMAEKDDSSSLKVSSPSPSSSSRPSISSPRLSETPREELPASIPPPYQEHADASLPEVQIPSQLPTTDKLDIDLRWTVLCDLFLVLIADSVYDSRSRVLLEKVGHHMSIDWLEICRFEKRVTDALEMQQQAEKENWNEDEHKETRRKAALKKRYMYMGLATVGGTLVIGLSAGLLAPLIGAGLAAGFTTIGVAGTGGFLAGAGGAAIITSAAATSGGVIAVRAANRRTGAVKTFEYRPLHNNKRVNLIITVSGWMTGKVDDVRLPYSTVDPIMGDIYSVLWEPEMLRSMGDTINILATEALTQGLQQVLASTILTALMAALTLPVVLTKLSYLIDNPWTVSLDRADMAGLILADSLIDRNLGTRPVTFVGYSLGSRVIFSCLRELQRKGAYGLVQNVYLFGSPIVAKREEYLKAVSVVSGRFVNGYATNDWILGYLFRLTKGGISRVAGLGAVENINGLENLNVTDLVPGHMAYRTAMPRLLREAGWLVESDEFTEIEDPDPDNHQERQRELINEIEAARREFERQEQAKGSKPRKFSLFGKKKKGVEKKEWEMYAENKGVVGGGSDVGKDGKLGDNDHVLFDVDAIRKELAGEMVEVRELQSTLPPMKLDLASPTLTNPRDSLRETKSFDTSGLSSASKTNGTGNKTLSTNSTPHRRKDSYDEELDAAQDTYPHSKSHKESEGEIQMTFETPFKASSRNVTPSYTHSHQAVTTPPAPTSWDQVDNKTTSHANMNGTGYTEKRPELKSSVTAPVAAVGLGSVAGAAAGYSYATTTMNDDAANGKGLEHNAWADDDDDEFQEKEMTMTFG